MSWYMKFYKVGEDKIQENLILPCQDYDTFRKYFNVNVESRSVLNFELPENQNNIYPRLFPEYRNLHKNEAEKEGYTFELKDERWSIHILRTQVVRYDYVNMWNKGFVNYWVEIYNSEREY